MCKIKSDLDKNRSHTFKYKVDKMPGQGIAIP
jgi:hypothetical protein